MEDKYNLCSRNGKLRMDSDGVNVTLTAYPTAGHSAVLPSASMTVSIEDLRQVVYRVMEVSEEQLSERDVKRIGNEVERRILVYAARVLAGKDQEE